MSAAVPTIPSDQPSIFDQLTVLDQRAIVSPNDPPAGIAGFLFDFDAEQYMELVSEITDNPVEDNTTLQDQIALLPERVTLKGMVSELTDRDTSFPPPPPKPAPLPLFPGLFPQYALGANLSFGAKLGALGVQGLASVGIGPDGKLSTVASLTGSVGPFSADAILRTVTGQLGGAIALDVNVRAAVNSAVNTAIKAVVGGNNPAAGAIAAAINTAVKNVAGSAITPAVTSLITQSVNSSISTAEGAGAGPAAGAAASMYEYYLNRSPVQPGQTAQSVAFGFFYQMWLSRKLFTVETPWGIMTDMGILNVRPEQPEETKGGTNFSVTFKKVRIAKSVTVNLGQLAGRNAFQAAADAPSQNGTAGQTPAAPAQEESWLRTLLGGPAPFQPGQP